MALLELEAIETSYGLSQALFGITLSVERGTIVALLGRNGAGKTTVMRSIMGPTPPHRGIVRWKGRRSRGFPPTGSRGGGLASCQRTGGSSRT